MDDRFDDLIDSADMKLKAGAPLSKDEANAWMARGLFNPTNQVYFRAGLIACREYMARFVEAQSPETAASIRANWWPAKLGPDFGPPRLMHWNELVKDGRDEPPIECRDDISPTLEALPIALQFLQSANEPPSNTVFRMPLVEPRPAGVALPAGPASQVAAGMKALDDGHDPLCMSVLRGKACTCGVGVVDDTTDRAAMTSTTEKE